jgi:hypothetical protein
LDATRSYCGSLIKQWTRVTPVPKRRKTRHPQFKVYRGREPPAIPAGELLIEYFTDEDASDGAPKVKMYKTITIYGGSNSKASVPHTSQS